MLQVIVIHIVNDQVVVALCSDRAIVGTKSFPSRSTSKLLAYSINELLEEFSLRIDMIRACIVGNGPGSISTMRSIFATVNGIASSMRISHMHLPLISVDSFAALYDEYNAVSTSPAVIALYTAYGDDFFYLSRSTTSQTIERGMATLDACASLIQKHFSSVYAITIIGSIRSEHRKILQQSVKKLIEFYAIQHASLETIIAQGHLQLSAKNSQEVVMPYYTKKHQVELM